MSPLQLPNNAMTNDQIRLHFGELNASEMRLARAIVGWHERQIEELKCWANKAAQELSGHVPLVDWQFNSKRLNEQIQGRDAIGYEWAFWHIQQDEGRAAKERIVSLFDEWKKLTN